MSIYVHGECVSENQRAVNVHTLHIVHFQDFDASSSIIFCLSEESLTKQSAR